MALRKLPSACCCAHSQLWARASVMRASIAHCGSADPIGRQEGGAPPRQAESQVPPASVAALARNRRRSSRYTGYDWGAKVGPRSAASPGRPFTAPAAPSDTASPAPSVITAAAVTKVVLVMQW